MIGSPADVGVQQIGVADGAVRKAVVGMVRMMMVVVVDRRNGEAVAVEFLLILPLRMVRGRR